MEIICIPTGQLLENAYIVYEPGNQGALLVDPGDNAPDIMGTLREHSLVPALILLTHAHWDHTGAIAAIQEEYDTPVAVHENDKGLLEGDVPQAHIQRYLKGREQLQGCGMELEVIHTPGHTGGSVCYLINGVLFSGDTLFEGSIGRTDFAESSWRDMQRSLEVLKSLPPETVVYPGHGGATTIGAERAHNPWMR